MMKQDHLLTLKGEFTVFRQNRETGEWLEPLRKKNTIIVAGKNIFLDLAFGLNTTAANQFDNAATELQIEDTGNLPVSVSPISTKAGYPDAVDVSHQVEYWFEDLTASAYDADDLYLVNTEAAPDIIFSQKLATGWSKPSTQNWTYKYTLTIGRGADTDLLFEGLDLLLKIFTGEAIIAGNHYDTLTDIYVEATGGTPNATISVDALGSRSGQTVTMVFTSGVGSHDIEWLDVSVMVASVEDSGSGPANQVILNATQENFDPGSTKGSSIERVYTFTFSV